MTSAFILVAKQKRDQPSSKVSGQSKGGVERGKMGLTTTLYPFTLGLGQTLLSNKCIDLFKQDSSPRVCERDLKSFDVTMHSSSPQCINTKFSPKLQLHITAFVSFANWLVYLAMIVKYVKQKKCSLDYFVKFWWVFVFTLISFA